MELRGSVAARSETSCKRSLVEVCKGVEAGWKLRHPENASVSVPRPQRLALALQPVEEVEDTVNTRIYRHKPNMSRRSK
jgi:hypothetical protein